MYAKNIWKDVTAQKQQAMDAFGKDYIEFLSYAKTERLAVEKSVELAQKAGFKPIEQFTSLKKGDKVYFVNKAKNIVLYVIGEKSAEDGIRILGAHIDSPRLDVKQNPLYEDGGFALLDTHYYGGVKKYQWVTVPLAIHGVVCKKDGSVVNVNVGEDPSDPIVGISDLLIHLSADQLQKTGAKVVEGENLDVTVGSIPLAGEEKNAVKANVLKLLNEKYGMDEEDFLSAELEIVPAGNAREYGLDRSMIAGYGHDDRVCAYTSMRAVMDQGACEYTTCCVLVDKEEIGSVGATGAQSLFFENTVMELLAKEGKANIVSLRHALERSFMLSSDVSAGFDPLYAEVSDKKNSAYLGNGIVFNKYTGARGKSGSNDANPEYFAFVRRAMDEAGVYYQTAELGKVDQGGGGTIAYILGNLNMNVVDAGVAVLNMHAPLEVVSKADVYEAYLAYKAFVSAKN